MPILSQIREGEGNKIHENARNFLKSHDGPVAAVLNSVQKASRWEILGIMIIIYSRIWIDG